MSTVFFRRLNEKVKLRGDESKHEQTDQWSNRDIIPLPPSRRTWGLMEYYGYWTMSSLGVVTWQTPGAFLTLGLSVGETMAVIVVSRLVMSLWAIVVAWAGLKFHIGFTVQNRYSWGMRASYIPLLQRVLLNFIWNAIQCWNGGKLAAVCITAIWPSFTNIKNTFPASLPTTTHEFVGFVVFWFISIPFLWLPPEKFRIPFQVITIYCGISMISMMIWSVAVAKGVGPVFRSGQNTSSSAWSVSWIMMSAVNSSIGSQAAGMTNGSDFSRYGRSKTMYIVGTALCLFVTGTLACIIGLTTTAACQKLYGAVYWNPPDLLMVVMDYGKGSAKARAGVFFLSLGFGLTSMFENIVVNATAGGIDLAGIFPQYINIRRGALITFAGAWICQPWQLINRASTFISVISSFSVFLAPLMGIMVADFYFVRNMRIKLGDLYKVDGSYYYWYGINWRALLAWIIGWAPTIGGLVVTTGAQNNRPRALYELYYIAFFYGFFSSFIVFYVINKLFPVAGCGEMDEVDIFGTFTEEEARKLGILPLDNPSGHIDFDSDEKSQPDVEIQSRDMVHVDAQTKLQQIDY